MAARAAPAGGHRYYSSNASCCDASVCLCVSLLTRVGPWGSGAVEIATRKVIPPAKYNQPFTGAAGGRERKARTVVPRAKIAANRGWAVQAANKQN